MKTFSLVISLLGAASYVAQAASPPEPYGATPTNQQVDWLRMEWYAFVHFGLNTYTDREWGYGDESGTLFHPDSFDAESIVSTFQQAGMQGMIYTAKHHDGWCTWPTRSTKHNITQSPWKKGKGDVVREFANACQKHKFKFGVYLSPWDRNCADYGKPGYLKVYYKQIKELLTAYGPIFEIWFDGANGGDGYYGGAREKRNIGNADSYYNYQKITQMIRRLQPDCIIWGAGQRGDVVWGGSEKGIVPYPCWNVINKDEPGERWLSLEGDTTINQKGWFWHPGQEVSVKSPEQLMDIYFQSVGHGANLILNLAPNRKGQLDPADVQSLMVFAENRKRLLSTDYALHAQASASEVRGQDSNFAATCVTDGNLETYWCPEDGTTQGEVVVKLSKPATFDVIRLREQIRLGQRVERFCLDVWMDGAWKTVDADGQTIGNQVLRRLSEPVTTDRVRLRILNSRACPCISQISLLRMPVPMPRPEIRRRGNRLEANNLPGYRLLYTTDGRDPAVDSPELKAGTVYEGSGLIKAAFLDTIHNCLGPVAMLDPGLCKLEWKTRENATEKAIDDDPETFWESRTSPASVTIQLNKAVTLGAFSYLPRQDDKYEGMTDRYELSLSQDGKTWRVVARGEFSNLRANPIEQKVSFKPTMARFVRFTATRALEGTGVSAAEIHLYPAKQQKRK